MMIFQKQSPSFTPWSKALTFPFCFKLTSRILDTKITTAISSFKIFLQSA